MILLCNGDSWTQGDSPAQTINWEATKTEDWYDIVPNFGNMETMQFNRKKILYKFYDSPVWPKVLGKKLGVETWNAGRLGDDNYGIAYRTIHSVEYLHKKNKKDIFVIIGWTSKLRLPLYVLNNGEVSLEQNRPGTINDHADKIFNFDKKIESDFLTNILLLQNYLNSKKINYLFFNAFDKLDFFNDLFISPLIDKTKWINYDPCPSHFKSYILQKYNLSDWHDKRYFTTMHPKDISHIAWADYLYKYIQTL